MSGTIINIFARFPEAIFNLKYTQKPNKNKKVPTNEKTDRVAFCFVCI